AKIIIESLEQASLEVLNLSATGLAVKNILANWHQNVATKLKATLTIDSLNLSISLILVRQEQNTAAFMFEPAPYQLANFIITCFPNEIRGQKLIKVDSKNLKSGSIGSPNWYYDGR